MTALTAGEFSAELTRASRSLFRIEAFPDPALTVEAGDFARFKAGVPTPPGEMTWYQPWADQVRLWAEQGITLTRVRVLTEPPTDYQRWLLWAGPWFGELGERIWYMTRRTAVRVGLPLEDWWLIDGERVITVRFTPDGKIDGYELITDPGQVEVYRVHRDLALDNSTAETLV